MNSVGKLWGFQGVMAKDLPFVVKPRRKPVKIQIGNENCGILEIEARGYLTVAEKFYVSQVLNGDRSVALMLSLSNKLAKRFKKDQQEGYLILTDYMQNKSSESYNKIIQEEFQEQVEEVMSEITRISSMRELAQATVMMRSRIDEDWTTDDTLELDSELIEALVQLYNKEESREYPEATGETVTNEQEYEIAVGKPQEEAQTI
jgi:hypothetical protein